jgi:CSLREA domain-containing protein
MGRSVGLRPHKKGTKMISTKTTTKTEHFFKALVVLASLLAVLAVRPAHATPTFAVNFTGDLPDRNVGDGVCDVTTSTEDTCTLRAAIQEANATSGADTIGFNILSPASDCNATTRVCTITPTSVLPPVTERVTIDGYTQPGASLNTKAVGDDAALKIQLDGTSAGGVGLKIQDASNSVIKGLIVNRFGEGITVGGDSVANRIEGNFIGTGPKGTLDRGNIFDGVAIFDGSSETVVGGSAPAKRNVISGNGRLGLLVDISNGSRIEGNYVGTDKSGTKDLGNADGVLVQNTPAGATIGGTTAASRNVISGNDRTGLSIVDAQGTKALGNRIGTTVSGTGALGNGAHGVLIAVGASNNSVGDGTSGGSNTIAFNGQDGVEVDGTSTHNEVSRNSVFSNTGLGIDLIGQGEGVFTNVSNPNDPSDTDSGANNLQNTPVLSSAKSVSGKTTIKGNLTSTPNQTYTIEFYSNPKDTNEGKKFLGEKSVATSVDGLLTFTFTPAASVSGGQTITATVTRDSTHDTSEFSVPRKVVAS